MMTSSSAAVTTSNPVSLSDLQLSPLIGDQQKDLGLTISSTSPPFLLVAGDNTQHLIFSCFHSCNPILRDKGTRWLAYRFHKEKEGMCSPLPSFQHICSHLIIEKSGCSQIPVFSGKPTSCTSPYYLCSCCLSAGSVRKRHLKNVSAVRGCRHSAPPLELLQWRGILFDGVEKVSERLESSSSSHLLATSAVADPIHSFPSITLSSSPLEVHSLNALPPSSSSSSLFATSIEFPAPSPPLLSCNDGETSSSSSSVHLPLLQ